MNIEEKFGVRSTFFFLNESKRTNIFRPSTFKLTLGNYSIHDPRIVKIIRQLDALGWEIAVHGSYDSYDDPDMLKKEKTTLESILSKPIIGVRQHYLRLKIPNTWAYQKKAGFLYDSSYGYTDRVGHREGRHIPFAPDNDNFIVLPLTIMDGPLFSNFSLEDAWKRCNALIEDAENNNSLLNILWHNNRFNDDEFPGQTKVFEKIISECLDRGAWVAPCRDIATWCMDGY